MITTPYPQDIGNRVPVRDFTMPGTMELPVDGVTLADFIAFDGDLAQVTDRMLAAMQRVVGALS